MLRRINRNVESFRSFCIGIGATAVIYPAALFTSFALGLANLGIVFFARDIFNASPAQIGWLAGTWSLTYTISCLGLRPFFGHIAARYLVIVSSFMMGLCILAIQFVPSLPWVFACFALYGVFMSMFWPPLMAWLSGGHEGKELTRRFARYNLMWSFGSIVSPYVCGELAEMSARYPLAIGTAVFFLTTAFVSGAALVLPHEDGATSCPSADSVPAERDAVTETLLRYPAWVGMFAGFFAFGALLAVFPLAARKELSITDGTVGVLFLARALFSTASFMVIGRTSGWHFKFLPMVAVQFVGITCFLLLAGFQSTLPIGLLFGVLGIVMAFSYSVSIFHGASGSANRIKRMAIHESTLSFGLIAGSAAGGMLYDVAAVRQVYLMCAAIFVAVIIVQLLLYAILCRGEAR